MKLIYIIIFSLFPLLAFGKERKLKFEGTWDMTKKEMFIPVKGIINDEIPMLKLNFENLGLIQLTITNQEGEIVYQEMIHTERNSLFVISLKSFPIEKGIISITDGKNMIYSIINL